MEPSETLTHNGLVYEVAGSGPTVVVLHGGIGLDHQYLRPMAAQWTDFARVVLFDHRGNGRSAAPEDWSEVTLDTLADDVDGIREAVGAERTYLFGHSYGGFCALRYALRHPGRLHGLILAATAAHVKRPPSIPQDSPAAAVEAFASLFEAPMESDDQWAGTWKAAFPLYAPELDEQAAARVTGQTIYRAGAWNRGAALLADYDVSGALARIDAPTLLLAGAKDFLTGVESHEELRDGMADAELVVFEDSGHFPFLSDPVRFRSVVEDWLGRRWGRPAASRVGSGRP